MIRILFGLLILGIFLGCYLYFMWAVGPKGEGKRWYFGSDLPIHLVGVFIGIVCAASAVFALAQPMAFLKYIFG